MQSRTAQQQGAHPLCFTAALSLSREGVKQHVEERLQLELRLLRQSVEEPRSFLAVSECASSSRWAAADDRVRQRLVRGRKDGSRSGSRALLLLINGQMMSGGALPIYPRLDPP